MDKATFVKDLDGWTGTAKLYKLSKPIGWGSSWDDEGNEQSPENSTEFVIVSATVAMFSGAETYIFPADENGNCLSFGELDGSYRGGLNHEAALNGAGYQVE